MTDRKSKLEQIRQREGISRAEVAAALDISERTVYRLEKGLTPRKRVYLRALARLYGMSLEELEAELDEEADPVRVAA